MKEEEINISSNEEILGGIKSAVERGADLKSAMMTFYRSGYSKKEIEDAAARYLQKKKQGEYVQEKVLEKELPKNKTKPVSGEIKPGEVKSGETKKEKTQTKPLVQKPVNIKQKVSNYGEKKKAPFEKSTILLIVILIILLGILGVVFLFQGEIVDFINKLFG